MATKKQTTQAEKAVSAKKNHTSKSTPTENARSKQADSKVVPEKKEPVKKVEAKVEEKPVEVKEEKVTKTPKIDLTILTVAELRELAKKKEIKGYSKMKKEELISALK